jgi:hypothetical protein
MKPWPFLLAILFALFAHGCADPLEKQSGQDVGSRLERGVTGQGQLTERESQRDAGDPAAEHGIPSRP